MPQERESKLHEELFRVRKEITAVAKDQAATSQRMLELVEEQERLEAELAALKGKGEVAS